MSHRSRKRGNGLRRLLAPLRLIVSVALAVSMLAGAMLPVLAEAASTAKHKHARHHKHRAHRQAYNKKKDRHKKRIKLILGGKGGGSDPGDDYPARLKNARQDSLLDPWKEFNRECTSFAAWALASRNGFVMPFYANARDWGPKAIARGYTVNSTPAPGSIAWSNRGTWGHVAYVQDVVGSSVHIEEYNQDGRGHYSTRTVPASSFTGYIHFRDRPGDFSAAPAPVATPGAPAGGGSSSPGTPGAPVGVNETTGGVTHTWTNYTNAGGTEGPSIPSNATVQVACKLQGFRVADGNTWWYRIASSPWNGVYYASADAFYNNGATSGSLHGTPFVDGSVPDC